MKERHTHIHKEFHPSLREEKQIHIGIVYGKFLMCSNFRNNDQCSGDIIWSYCSHTWTCTWKYPFTVTLILHQFWHNFFLPLPCGTGYHAVLHKDVEVHKMSIKCHFQCPTTMPMCSWCVLKFFMENIYFIFINLHTKNLKSTMSKLTPSKHFSLHDLLKVSKHVHIYMYHTCTYVNKNWCHVNYGKKVFEKWFIAS